jgi:hypothetical protein
VLAVDWTAAEPAMIVMGHRQMSARDAVDLAVMEHLEALIQGLMGFLGITRLS